MTEDLQPRILIVDDEPDIIDDRKRTALRH